MAIIVLSLQPAFATVHGWLLFHLADYYFEEGTRRLLHHLLINTSLNVGGVHSCSLLLQTGAIPQQHNSTYYTIIA